jgi:CHAT domain-containing protein
MRWHIHFGIILLALRSANCATAADPEALLARADHLVEIGNSIKARPLYAEAEREFHARGDRRNELYAKFGRLHHDVETGSYSAAALEVEQDLKNPVVQNDPALKIRALALKGVIDLNLNTAGAEEDFSQIAALAKSTGDRKWANRAAGELGIIAGINGNIGAAAVALLKAISTAEALHDLPAQISFSTWLANGMTVNGRADKAIAVLDRAVNLVPKDPDAGFPAQLYIAKIRALVTLAQNGTAPNGKTEAERLIGAALKYSRDNGILGAQCELLNQAGLLSMSAHDLNRGEDYFRQTVDVAKRAHLPRMEAEGYLHLSEIYEQHRDLNRATSTIDSAIEQVHFVQEGFDLPVYMARKAEIEAARGNLQRADELYDQASDLIEAMLVNAPSSQVKSSMIAALSDIYVGHFRLAVERFHDNAKAFQIIETARGRALFDSMRYASRSNDSNSTSAPERQIVAMQKRLREERLSLAETKLLLAKLDETYDRLAPIEYKRSRPEMRMARRPPVPIATLQRSLIPGEALIEYVLDNRGNSHALEITQAEIRIHQIPSKAAVSELCGKFIQAVKEKKDPSKPGQALLAAVISPVISTHPSSLVIVPDGLLNLVPFAALLGPGGGYLAQSLIISLAPSATVFQMLRSARRESEPQRPFLGVAYSPGGTAGEGGKGYVASRGLDLDLAHLKPLLFARDEVESGARTLGAGSLVLPDDKATESSLKSEPLQDFKIIHLALHGFGDMTEPDRAGLVLAPGDLKEDGLWQAREIRESRFAADVVTLSACETGVGRLQGEEGIMNLARTFLVAGAKSVVASLWDADDRSTATLMKHFYEEVAQGKNVAEALRGAQLTMLREFGSDLQPYYWAGFTVIGDGSRQIKLTQTNTAVKRAAGGNIQ